MHPPLSHDRADLYVLCSHHKFSRGVGTRRSLGSVHWPHFAKGALPLTPVLLTHQEVTTVTVRAGPMCQLMRSFPSSFCVFEQRAFAVARAVIVVSPRSTCVCSFRALFLLKRSAVCLELLAVLPVTLHFVAIVFIPSPLRGNNA